ncbi:MAG: aminopeptidase P family protein [Chloroflexi bacterium]|nr:aminopeptidase P family protein [Chloroflexota bacterium]
MPKTKWFTKNFSEKERDRRWQKTREFLQKEGLDGLLVLSGTAASEPMDRYLSNWPSGTVIFPLKGEPILLVGGLGDMLAIKPEMPKGVRPWIKDVRTGARGAMIVAALKDAGLERAHVGVVGVGPLRTQWEGWVTYGTWDRVVKRLPDCKFEDVAPLYGEKVMLLKSDEEIAHFRYASDILEEASAAMLKAVRAGATEYDVWFAMAQAWLNHGMLPHITQFGSGPNAVGPRPLWVSGAGAPRVLEPGDVFITEIMAWSKEIEAQVQMCVAVPPVSKVDAECARLARQSYLAGLRVLKAGKTFEEVEAEMFKPLDRKDVWFQTPLLHSLNPMVCIGRTGIHIERMPGVEKFPQVGTGHIRGGEVVLQPGMMFQLEPNACIGMHRVLIGGNVLVTEGEPEELNKLPMEMQIAKGTRVSRAKS